MSQRVFHGLDPITPELKEVIYACTNCLMCQELCGVRNDGYGPWDITVAMREEIAAKEGPIDENRPIYEGVRDGWVRPHVDCSFPLERGGEAHTYMEERRNTGKVVLTT